MESFIYLIDWDLEILKLSVHFYSKIFKFYYLKMRLKVCFCGSRVNMVVQTLGWATTAQPSEYKVIVW